MKINNYSRNSNMTTEDMHDSITHVSDECECECDCDCDCECEEKEHETVYFKYEFEGCETIESILERLEDLKQQFLYYKEHGYKMVDPVDTGFCFLEKPGE